MNTYEKEIKSIDDFILLLADLYFDGKAYHCEDDALEVINGQTQELIFSKQEATELNKRMGEAYDLDWSGTNTCPCGIALAIEKILTKDETWMQVIHEKNARLQEKDRTIAKQREALRGIKNGIEFEAILQTLHDRINVAEKQRDLYANKLRRIRDITPTE